MIDREKYLVYKAGEPLHLPKKEFELLFFLAQNPNKVFSRDDLLQNIWGSDVYVLARTVDVAPTLAALAGVRPTAPTDGRPLIGTTTRAR